ncbi:MAG TPA: zf-HC2 domain-containing protein [Vicinamibacterales bacterium]|nr:zf-HC2 domain-containing protein [Vicinamibacterales bacterium]
MKGSGCADVRELLDSYLSNELLVETNHRVIAHLEACPACAEELSRRRRLREILRQALLPGPDPSAVERRVLAQVSRRPARTSWLAVRRFGWIAAAALVAAASAAWWLSGLAGTRPDRSRTPAGILPVAYQDSIDNHKECALTLPATLRLDPDRVAVRFDAAYRGVMNAVAESAAPYELADAHDCRHHDSYFRHLVLRGNGHTISVMALRTSSPPLPPPGAKRLEARGTSRSMWQFREGPYEAAAMESAGHLAMMVSDLGDDAHARLAGRVLPSMARALEEVRAR